MSDRSIITANPANESEPAKVQVRRKRRWPWAVLALVLIIAIIGIIMHRRQPAAQAARPGRPGGAPPPLMVSTATAQKGDIGVYVSALGVVTPVNTVAVKSRVDGQLVKVLYKEGQVINAGDALVEIDTRPFQAALAQAEGQLARDSALLENARV